MNERHKSLENEMRTSWFKDHVAAYKVFKAEDGEIIEFLRWGKPNSSTFSVTYMFRFGFLFVYGDLGEAVYQWHPSIGTLRNIAGCNLDYFAGKCSASENGRGYKSWDEDSARESILDHMMDKASYDEDKTFDALSEEFRELGGWEAIHSEYSWIKWLEDNGFNFFGDEYFEYGGIGMEIDSRCRSHLVGLKMAFEQIESQKEAENV